MTAIWILAGAILGYFAKVFLSQKKISQAEQEANKIINKAQAKLEEAAKKEKEIVLLAKEEASKIRERAETIEQKRRVELGDWEKRLGQKDETLDRRTGDMDKKQEAILKQDADIKEGIVNVSANQPSDAPSQALQSKMHV